MNLWILRGETPDKKGFEFLNAIRDHKSFSLELVQIRHFDAPDKLVLRGQVILEGDSVRFEPFHPKPVSASIPTVKLCMSLQAAENGLLTIPDLDPPLAQIRFIVTNRGEQTVRDFRNTVLIPSVFRRATSDSYLGNLSRTGDTLIKGQHYVVYGNFTQEPIYKKESVRIGSLPLKAPLGDYNLFWQIRCDDGVFPPEDNYGQVRVKVIDIADWAKNNA